MENQQTLALMKERLREKEREIRSRDATQAKNEERIKRVLSLSEEKIVALKETVSVQEKEEKPAAATKEVQVQDPKLLEELEELRKKNNELSEKTNVEEKERKKLQQEKSFLVKEFKKLKRSNVDKVQTLQTAGSSLYFGTDTRIHLLPVLSGNSFT